MVLYSHSAPRNGVRILSMCALVSALVLGVGCGSSSSNSSSNLMIETVAGTGARGYIGDGGPAASARLSAPFGVAVDGSGNLYIADTSNNVIRMVNTNNAISTVAGSNVAGNTGNGGAATSAKLSAPSGIAVDAAGNLYIADTTNNVVRKVTSAGVISLFAGTGTSGYTGDGGAATSAKLSGPYAIAIDSAGNIYIADSGNNVIRKVTSAGIISTIAGTGTTGYIGDGGVATSAKLSWPTGVAVDASGNVYIADTENAAIRKVSPAGTITTVAGNGVIGYGGDGGPATSAKLNYPIGVAVDASGNILISDTLNAVIREVTSAGTISTIAGVGTTGYTGDGTAATGAKLNSPYGVAVDASGNLYIADSSNNVIRALKPKN